MAILQDDKVKFHQGQIVSIEIKVVMFFFFSMKRCINIWSRSCIDNARVQDSVKPPPAHPKDFQ